MIVFQPKSHFQSSSRGEENTSASSSAKPASAPLSYAEFIVQSKSNVGSLPDREAPSKSEPALVSSAPGGCETVQDCGKCTEDGPEGVKKSEETQVAGTDQKEGNCQRSDLSLNLGPKPVGSGSSIIVSPRQVCIKNNYTPLMLYIHTPLLCTCIPTHITR